ACQDIRASGRGAQELVLIEPAGSDSFGLGGNAGCGVVEEAETPLRRAAVIVLRFDAPAIGRSDVAVDVIRHRALAAVIDRPNEIRNSVGLDVASRSVAAERVGDLVEAFLSFLPGRFSRRFQISDIGLEEIGHGAWPRVTGDFDAASLLN